MSINLIRFQDIKQNKTEGKISFRREESRNSFLWLLSLYLYLKALINFFLCLQGLDIGKGLSWTVHQKIYSQKAPPFVCLEHWCSLTILPFSHGVSLSRASSCRLTLQQYSDHRLILCIRKSYKLSSSGVSGLRSRQWPSYYFHHIL